MVRECPSCKSEVDVQFDVCPTCGHAFQSANPVLKSIVQGAARPKIQVEVEIATTVDRTGSSERFKSGIPMTFEMILNLVTAKARSVRCWVQSHGDLDEGQDFILHTNGEAADQAILDVKRISYGGGGDPPEHHLDAVENLMKTTPWSCDPTSRGAILAFMTSGSKPAKSGISARELGEEIARQGMLLYLVCEKTPELAQLSGAANGLMFEISNNPDPRDLQRIAAALAASIVQTVKSGSTVPMVASQTH